MISKILAKIEIILTNEGENLGVKERYGVWDDR
jgi:hypothetical protein